MTDDRGEESQGAPARPDPPPLVTVVMPAHNEADYLAAAVADVAAALTSRGIDHEILVVENGSTDATAEIARGLAAEVGTLRSLSMGAADYGRALQRGFAEAQGELVVIFDVDYYDFDFLDAALEAMTEAGPGGRPLDLVVGSKRAEGATDHRDPLRRAVTATFGTILKLGFGLKLSDTHGIKVLRREPFLDIAARSGHGTDIFDTELVLRAERAGLATAELPVEVRQRRPSRSSIIRRVPRTLVGLGRLRVALWREDRARRAQESASPSSW